MKAMGESRGDSSLPELPRVFLSEPRDVKRCRSFASTAHLAPSGDSTATSASMAAMEQIIDQASASWKPRSRHVWVKNSLNANMRTGECAYLALSHCRFFVMGIDQSHFGLKTNIAVIREADKGCQDEVRMTAHFPVVATSVFVYGCRSLSSQGEKSRYHKISSTINIISQISTNSTNTGHLPFFTP